MEAVLTEFHTTADWLKSQIDSFLDNHKESKKHMFKLLEHNRKLIAELKRNTQGEVTGSSGDQTIHQLQQQLKEALDSKASVVELWQKVVKELELEKQSKQESVEEQVIDERIASVNDYYAKGLNILSQELSEARNQLTSTKDEVKKLTEEVMDLKSTLAKCERALKTAESQVDGLNFEKNQLADELMRVRAELAEKSALVESKLKKNAELIDQKRKIDALNKELSEQLSALNHEKTVSEKEAKDCLLTAQEAILQKKEISYKEQVALKLIQNLKSSVDQEVEYATLRYKSEIKNMQRQNSEKIKAMMSEIKSLQSENSEKQSTIEKFQRQMHATEAKLQAVYTDSAQYITVTAYNDMCRRVTLAEKARDESFYKIHSLEATLRDLKVSSEREMEFYKCESKSWKEQFQKLQNSLNKITEDRLSHSDLVMCFRKKCAMLEKDLKATRNQHEKEISLLGEAVRQKEELFSQQMQLAEDHFKEVVSEQKKLLEAQNKTAKKWKDALHELTLSSELKMKDMFQDILILQKEKQEISDQLQQLQKLSIQKSSPLSLV